MLRIKYFFYCVLVLLPHCVFAQNVPLGYIVQYEQNFTGKTSCNDFKYSNPDNWKIKYTKGNYFLEFSTDTTSADSLYLPGAIAILDNYIFGDFILEAEIAIPAKENLGQNICIFLGIRDSINYYYVQLAPDSSQGIFLVNKANKSKLTTNNTQEINWVKNTWYKVKIKRNIVERTIRVYLSNMQKPLMEVKDMELIMGYIGFGSFNGIGRIDNIKIWSQTSIPEPALFFKPKHE